MITLPEYSLNGFKEIKSFLRHFSNKSITSKIFLNRFEELQYVYTQLSDYDSRATFIRLILANVFAELTSNPYLSYQLAGYNYAGESQNTFIKQISNPEVQAFVPCCPANDNGDRDKALYDTFIVEQYAYFSSENDISIRPEPGDICIDGGGYIADTAIWMADICKADKVYEFEFIEENIRCSEANIKRRRCENKIEIVKAGLSNHCGEMQYLDKDCSTWGAELIRDPAAYISKYGSDKLNICATTTIDAFCNKFDVAPDFIKMDIEGAEVIALEGASYVLKHHRPKLALSAYHKKTDLLDIPIKIKEANPEYDIYLYCRNIFSELDFFAIVSK